MPLGLRLLLHTCLTPARWAQACTASFPTHPTHTLIWTQPHPCIAADEAAPALPPTHPHTPRPHVAGCALTSPLFPLGCWVRLDRVHRRSVPVHRPVPQHRLGPPARPPGGRLRLGARIRLLHVHRGAGASHAKRDRLSIPQHSRGDGPRRWRPRPGGTSTARRPRKRPNASVAAPVDGHRSAGVARAHLHRRSLLLLCGLRVDLCRSMHLARSVRAGEGIGEVVKWGGEGGLYSQKGRWVWERLAESGWPCCGGGGWEEGDMG
jgi:hypothetical protein